LGADLLDTNRALWMLLRVLQLGNSPILTESKINEAGSQLDSLAVCASNSIEFFADEKLRHHETTIKARYLKGAENIKLYVEMEGVPEDQKDTIRNGILVKIKSAAIGADENVDFTTVRS
jgi:hypothetical protein